MSIEQLGESLLADAKKRSRKLKRRATVFTGLMLGVQAGNALLRKKAKKRADEFWKSNQGLLDARAGQFTQGIDFWQKHNKMLSTYGESTDSTTGENWVNAFKQQQLKLYQANPKYKDIFSQANPQDQLKFNQEVDKLLADDIEAYRSKVEGFSDFRNIGKDTKESRAAYMKPLRDKLQKGVDIINEQDNVAGWLLGGMNLKSSNANLQQSQLDVLLPEGFTEQDKSELDSLISTTLRNKKKINAIYKVEEIPEVNLKAMIKKEKVAELPVKIDNSIRDAFEPFASNFNKKESQYSRSDYKIKMAKGDKGEVEVTIYDFLNDFKGADGNKLTSEQKNRIIEDAMIIADLNYKIFKKKAEATGTAGLTIPVGGITPFVQDALETVIGEDLKYEVGGFMGNKPIGTYKPIARQNIIDKLTKTPETEVPSPSDSSKKVVVTDEDAKQIIEDSNIPTDNAAVVDPTIFDEKKFISTINNPDFVKMDDREKNKFVNSIIDMYPTQSDRIVELVENSDMQRVDGTQKSDIGFLGPVKNNVTGGTMTELSMGVEMDGKEVLLPLMVPTLTKEEINFLANNNVVGNPSIVPQSIKDKAIAHARKRISENKSPFMTSDDAPTITSSEQEKIANMLEMNIEGLSTEEVDNQFRIALRQSNDLTDDEFNTILGYLEKSTNVVMDNSPVQNQRSLLSDDVFVQGAANKAAYFDQQRKTAGSDFLKLIGADKESVRKRIISRAEKYLAGERNTFTSSEFNKWAKATKGLEVTDIKKNQRRALVKEFLETLK